MSTSVVLTDDQRMIQESAAAFLERDSSIERVREWRAKQPGFDRKLWKAMAELGWLGLLLPEQYDGMGMGFAELSVLLQELSTGLMPEPLVAATVLGAGAIVHGDNDGLKGDLLPKIVAGDLVPALAWQEAEGVIDPTAVETKAEAADGGVKISGVKTFVPAADGADGFVVSAQGPDGLALYWLDKDAAGVTLDFLERVDGGYYGTLKLDNVAVGADRRVASSAVAATVLGRVMDEGRIAASAELLGVMSKALDISLDYIRERVQFGKPIGSFQALQHRSVDLYIQQELSRSTVIQGARIFDETDDPDRRAVAASQAKARCSDGGLRVTRECIQLHGGIGYTDECDIGLYLKRAMVVASWLGNGTAHRRRYAKIAPQDEE
ncbi:MAG: acyl-CoA dehydrogenase family protein [Alphaproteobacteria bacterium]